MEIESMKCKICDTRKPRRYCPGVGGDICTMCCGTEREVTVNCPLDCPFLMEARLHEKPPEINPDSVPNRDIRITEEFLRDHESLLIFLGANLLHASLETSGAVDSDVCEALESMIRTYRTLDSGLIYETRSPNIYASGIQDKLREAVEELRKGLQEQLGSQMLRDADVLGTLVFLQRLEIQHNNGRKRGRAFLDFLRGYLPEPSGPELATPGVTA